VNDTAGTSRPHWTTSSSGSIRDFQSGALSNVTDEATMSSTAFVRLVARWQCALGCATGLCNTGLREICSNTDPRRKVPCTADQSYQGRQALTGILIVGSASQAVRYQILDLRDPYIPVGAIDVDFSLLHRSLHIQLPDDRQFEKASPHRMFNNTLPIYPDPIP